MKKYFLFSVIVLFSVSIMFSQAKPNGVTLSKTTSGYHIEFSLPDYKSTYTVQDAERFIQLYANEYGITPETGKPMLPQLTFNLFISREDNSPTYSVSSVNSETKFLDAKIYPTQAPWEKNKELSGRPFTIDRAYYNTKGSINEPLVKISEPFIIAGVKGVRVTITPFAYDPSSNKLVVTHSAAIDISLQLEPTVSVPVASSFDQMFKKMFVNYSGTQFTGTNNYLIITAPEYEATMAGFVTFKQTMGYNVYMVNTTVTGTTTSAILNYIQQRYNNSTTKPEFILLVGDVDKIPCWTGIGPDNPNTDLNYTLLEGGDAFADAFIGRFSVSSNVELTNIINKTIYMETNINALPKKNIFMASNDNYTISEGTHNFVIDSFFGPGSYTNVKLYVHTYGATTQQLIDNLNANQSFAIYSGHGAETYWADGPVLHQSDVNALTNTVYPFTYAFSCLTGSFQVSECFGETWIRTQHGASVYWGSSVTSYWDEDDILERRMIRAMFNDGLIKTAPMFVMGKYYLVQYYGGVTSTMRRYLEMYNCFGDPSLYEATYGPAISHTPLPNTENVNGPFTVNCIITPAGSNIDPSKTKVMWTRGASFTDSISLSNTSGNNWTANIPGNGTHATYKYYLKTCDALGRACTLPGGAPANFFQFTAAPDTIAPVITHAQLPDMGQPQWPATVNCTATDNIGLDSVWVEWYKNIPANSKEFKLIHTTGTTYAAAFNSANNEVNIGDTIFYRIKAKDNSLQHNVTSLPASGYYSFHINELTSANLCRQTYLLIRDNTTTYDTFFVAATGNIVDFKFNMVSLIHTYDGDVSFSIITPQGQEVVLSANHGGGGDNYTNTLFNDSAATPIANGTSPFTGTFKPDNPMTGFIGHEIHGNWILKVTDNASADTGHVESYCLVVQYVPLVGITENQVPRVFELKQNYPNPFNPSTTIKFSIAKQSYVKLVVYDLLGREIMVPVNGMKQAGSHDIMINASNLASGVYFYRIEAGDFVNVKKMVLLK